MTKQLLCMFCNKPLTDPIDHDNCKGGLYIRESVPLPTPIHVNKGGKHDSSGNPIVHYIPKDEQ